MWVPFINLFTFDLFYGAPNEYICTLTTAGQKIYYGEYKIKKEKRQLKFRGVSYINTE